MTMAKKLPLLAPSIHTFEVNGTYTDCEAKRTVFMAIQKMVSAGKYYRIPYHGSSKKGYSYKRKDGGLTITLADYPDFKKRYITLSGVNLARIAGDPSRLSLLIHEKSSLAPPGQSLAFSLGDEKGFEWIGAYDITADELLAGTDTAKTESKTAQAEALILELLADGKRMPSAELEKAVNERGISSRTMRTAKSRIGDRLVTEKDGTAWVCYLRD